VGVGSPVLFGLGRGGLLLGFGGNCLRCVALRELESDSGFLRISRNEVSYAGSGVDDGQIAGLVYELPACVSGPVQVLGRLHEVLEAFFR
jgi:hypothetical protein